MLLSFHGRPIRAADAAFIKELIAQNPGLSRRRLSVRLCEAWQWKQPNGQWRDMACRTLMLVLHRAGHIELPARRFVPPNNAIVRHRPAQLWLEDTRLIEGTVAALGPLRIEVVRGRESETLFAQLVEQYHYLGYRRRVGECLKYLVYAADRPLACLAWSSAPLKLDLRDRFVGAPKEAYRHNLHQIAYNSRYLILPWVKVPHLASHLLGRIARRISEDWQLRYGHPLQLLESFVDIERFRGTCYRAANWICLGQSAGRGTRSVRGQPACSVKELWAYPLRRDFRQRLLAA